MSIRKREKLSGFEVAKLDLRTNYVKHGINAGQSHFSDVWARDAFYATLGANRIGDSAQSKITLKTFSKYQRQDGLIPLRVGDKYIELKFIGIHSKKIHPIYNNDKGKSYAVDPNALFIIASADYLKKTKDKKFIKQIFLKLTRAIVWLEKQDKNNNGLIEEGNYSNWADALKTAGEVIYSNVCYYKAMQSMSELAKVASPNEVKEYSKKAEVIKKAINDILFNGEFYDHGFDDKGNRRTWFATDGNVLAVIWGVADKKRSKKIIDYMIHMRMEKPFAVPLNKPLLPHNLTAPLLRFAGLKDYHTGELIWPWVGALYCLAKDMVYPKTGKEHLKKITAIYERDQRVHEIYNMIGDVENRLFYKSEHQFAWGAGLYLYAFKEMK